MKFSPGTIAAYEKAQEQSDKPLVKQYLNPTDIELNEEVEFILLHEDPLEFWEIWSTDLSTDRPRSFHFPVVGDEPPSDEDIITELGGNFVRDKAKYEQKKRGIKVGDPRPADLCFNWAVWNTKLETIQVLKISQWSLRQQIMKNAGLKKYRNKMADFAHSIHKTQQQVITYTYSIYDRDEDFDEGAMEKAWEEAKENGFSLEALMTNDDPFNPGGN